MEYIEKTLTGIITHGTNSITFTDDFITNESIIDVYFSSDDIVPTDQEQIGNRLIVSIEPQTYDVSIAVHITNDDTINYADELESLSDTVVAHATAISDLVIDIDTLENKVDGLNASNINYDEQSTLYSAMGDIDELETTSKNIVGAINEVKESGGGGGVFIDTSNIIRATSAISNNFEYTALQDSAVCVEFRNKNYGGVNVYINNVQILSTYSYNLPSSAFFTSCEILYIKQGDTIKFVANDDFAPTLVGIYGLK